MGPARLAHKLAGAGLGLALAASPAIAAPAMWRVSDADSSIYLFGSIHLFSRQMDWRTPLFDAELKAADHVYFEMVFDVAAYAEVTRLSWVDGRIKGGGKLWDYLTDDQYARFEAAVTAAGLPMSMFERFYPWMAEMMLSSKTMNGGGAGVSVGVELVVDAEVEPERKRGLETADEQMGFFSKAPIEQQVAGLMAAVDAMGTADPSAGLDQLTTAWENGDLDTMSGAVGDELGSGEDARYRTLLVDRNKRWVPTLEGLLASNDESLVIVGAAHLIGPDGVPALLEAAGYKVERVDRPAGEDPAPAGTPRR